jgi:predicted negative regulator of RcsB-dependent stress response
LRKRIKKKPSEEAGIFKKRLDNFSFNSKISFVIVGTILCIAMFFAYQQFQKNKLETTQKYAPNPLQDYYNKYYNKGKK